MQNMYKNTKQIELLQKLKTMNSVDTLRWRLLSHLQAYLWSSLLSKTGTVDINPRATAAGARTKSASYRSKLAKLSTMLIEPVSKNEWCSLNVKYKILQISPFQKKNSDGLQLPKACATPALMWARRATDSAAVARTVSLNDSWRWKSKAIFKK